MDVAVVVIIIIESTILSHYCPCTHILPPAITHRYHPLLRFHVDVVGTGIIETPLAMAPAAPGGAEEADADAEGVEAAADADVEVDADAAPASNALAWLGMTVVVLAGKLLGIPYELLEPEPEPGIEEPLEEPPLLLPLLRTRTESESSSTSMKVISGPATSALLCRCTALPFRGWSSDVMKIATGPLMPCGTTHWSIGREMEKGAPPVSIWQWKPEVLPLRAGELNAKEVPAVTAPVLVTESEGLAVTPRLQPLMKAPAIARTSWGRRGMSNDWGIVEAPAKMFSMVWWRDSMVTMEAAAVRTFGSWTRCAAPRYAPTPTFFYDPCDRCHGRDINKSTREIERATRRCFFTE